MIPGGSKTKMRIRKRRTLIVSLISTMFLVFLLHNKYPSFAFQLNFLRRKPSESVLRGLLRPIENHCVLPHLKGQTRLLWTNETHRKQTICQRLQPILGSCDIASHLFVGKKLPRCNQRKLIKICEIQSKAQVQHTVSCNVSSSCGGTVSMGTVDMATGEVKWSTYRDSQSIEKAVTQLMVVHNAGYCLLMCGTKTVEEEEATYYQEWSEEEAPEDLQILVIPAPIKPIKTASNSRKPFINFNLIFIDSVSRHHFYRSLPKTIKYFESITDYPGNENTVLLDFKLVQGIRSRTFETLQALFSGYVDPNEKPFSTLAMPPKPLKTEHILRPLKERGYNTLWMEDLCYLWEWGLPKDLRVHSKSFTPVQTWKKLHQAMKSASIDSLGNTYMNCQILKSNGVNDHFHGPNKVCFNGKHQHQYSLEYLRYYQEGMVNAEQPYFSFFETNIGHEDTGLRIQYLDSDLVDYFHASKTSLRNAITIIFSDHGNSYGHFNDASEEAKVELFHPFLFMIIPEKVQQLLGKPAMESLHINQERLISVLDVHYLLKTLTIAEFPLRLSDDNTINKVSDLNEQFNVTAAGLLSEISPDRVCDQIPRIMPNLCICGGFEETVSKNKFHDVLAMFAIGELNNELQRQHFVSTGVGGYGACRRLKMVEVRHVRESNRNDIKSVKMDIAVESPSSSSSKNEVFFVVFFVVVDVHKSPKNRIIKLVKYERITPYSPFKACSDSNVDLQLCVCSKNKAWKLNKQLTVRQIENPILSKKETKIKVGGSKCVSFLVQSNSVGVVVEAVNLCTVKFAFTLSMTAANLIMSRSFGTMEMTLKAGDVTFIIAGIEGEKDKDWKWDMSVL